MIVCLHNCIRTVCLHFFVCVCFKMHFLIPSSWQRLICTDPPLSCREHLFRLLQKLSSQTKWPTYLYEGSQWQKNNSELSECFLLKVLHRCMCRGLMTSPNQSKLTFSCLLLTSGGVIMAYSGLNLLQFSCKVWHCMVLIPYDKKWIFIWN